MDDKTSSSSRINDENLNSSAEIGDDNSASVSILSNIFNNFSNFVGSMW